MPSARLNQSIGEIYMTLEDYNSLDYKSKLQMAWVFWNQYIDINAPQFSWAHYRQFYGTRRFLINEMPIHRRDEMKFNAAMSMEILLSRQDPDRPTAFPIPHQRSFFDGCKYVVLERTLMQEEFHWIEDSIEVGTILEITTNNPYGVCSAWGIPCISPNKKAVVEIPMHCVAPVEVNST
jgi:hypothetical protein